MSEKSENEKSEGDQVFAEAESSVKDTLTQATKQKAEKPKKAKKEGDEPEDSFFKKNKKVIGFIGIGVLVLVLFVSLFGKQSVEVERPQQSEVEQAARFQSEVAKQVKKESEKLADQRVQIIDRISRNFDCNAAQVFCHTQDTTEPYTTVVSSLQNFQFLPDTPYEVYIEVYPLKVDSHNPNNPQSTQRRGSICSPNNVHLFLCQKVVMKNPALMANQIRELYALLTPSMTYRLQISGRPITATDIDLALIATEMDKLSANNIAAASEPEVECVPPDPETDPIAYNLYETGGRDCQQLMKDLKAQKQREQQAQEATQ